MTEFDFQPRTRVLFGADSTRKVGAIARQLGFSRTLLVTDPGLIAAGHPALVTRTLEQEGVGVFPFQEFGANPDSVMVEAARAFAAPLTVDSIIAVGGGSSMDLAKGVNLALHHSEPLEHFRGYGKCRCPLLPMIAVPTTAGTGSDAQSYAVLADSKTHMKMAIGDPELAFRTAILDPLLTVSQPSRVTAQSGFDAIAHAVESFVTTKRNAISTCYAREAWRLLSSNFERVLEVPDDLVARAAMLAGAHLAGAAIENSMLGAAHACANPLTARYNIVHGEALALMLPHVVRWNQAVVSHLYRQLDPDLDARLAAFAARLNRPYGIPRGDIPALAAAAATQWTGNYNPRPFDAGAAQELYECAL